MSTNGLAGWLEFWLRGSITFHVDRLDVSASIQRSRVQNDHDEEPTDIARLAEHHWVWFSDCGSITLCWLPAGTSGHCGFHRCVAAAWPMLASIRFARCPDDLGEDTAASSLLVLPAVLAVVTLRLFW